MNLKATERNVLLYIERDNKEKYKFKSGVELYIVKHFNFNLRQDNPSIGRIIDGNGLPTGALCLIHHNAVHETYHIEGIQDDNGQIIRNLYSVPFDMVYMYKCENSEWIPNKDFLITLRVYKPYMGIISGIEPSLVKQRLYVVKGVVDDYDMSGKCAIVTPYSDYEIIFMEDNVEKSVIRTRKREILGIDIDATDRVLTGEYLIGNNLRDLKNIKGNG